MQDRLAAQALGDKGARLEHRLKELDMQLAATVRAAGLSDNERNPLRANAKGSTWHPAQLRGACVCYFDPSGSLQVPHGWPALQLSAGSVLLHLLQAVQDQAHHTACVQLHQRLPRAARHQAINIPACAFCRQQLV